MLRCGTRLYERGVELVNHYTTRGASVGIQVTIFCCNFCFLVLAHFIAYCLLFISWRLRCPHWAEGIFGFCRMHVGCGLASGLTFKRPCAVLVWWWDGEQIKFPFFFLAWKKKFFFFFLSSWIILLFKAEKWSTWKMYSYLMPIFSNRSIWRIDRTLTSSTIQAQ